MAAKITLIAPFDQASGNLSGKQILKYAENNNPAYDAPVGKVNYARNYRTSYIAGIRSATGEGYLQVRKKSAVNLTTDAKKAMALLGGAGALYSVLVSRDAIKEKMLTTFEYVKSHGTTWANYTFRKYWMEEIRTMLANKRQTITRTTPTSLVIYNPWVYRQTIPAEMHVGDRVLTKFWTELATNPIVFYVGSAMGIAHGGSQPDTFLTLISGANYNVLGLTTGEVPGGPATGIYFEDAYLTFNDTPVEGEDYVTNGRKYSTVVPENP